MLYFIAGCFFGALVMFAAQTQGKRLSEAQEALQQKKPTRPIILEPEDEGHLAEIAESLGITQTEE